MELKPVKIGWVGLEKILNHIIEVVNANTPIQGSGIRIHDGVNGKIIEKADEGKGSGDGSGGQSGQQQSAGFIKILALDPNTLQVISVQVQGALSTDDVPDLWQPVTVVDPNSCDQSTIYVLEKPDDSG